MHINTSSQKNQHRDILAKKKKEIHKQTQTEKQKRDRSVLIGMIGARGYGSCLIGAREISACRSELGRTELWIGACDQSYGSVQLWIDACDRSCDRSCGSMLLWIDAYDRSCG